MALYQPSNITPSTLAGVGQGTIASDDAPVITWQINGTSAMTSFQIDVIGPYGDVTSTNLATNGCPAYGTDSKGNITPFVYATTGDWAHDFGVHDGFQHKLKIYQFYGDVSVPRFTISAAISKGLICQFGISGTYYTFVCPEDLAVNSTIDVHQGNLLVFNYGDSTGHISTAYATISSSYDGTSIQISGVASTASHVEEIVVPNSEVVFNARTAPVLNFYPPTTINTVSRTFTATYSQEQGDAIKWARWETMISTNAGMEVIDDTGEVATGILEYTYDSFLNDNRYTVRVTVETENGIRVSRSGTFNVTYNVGVAETGLSTTGNANDGSIKLSWQKPSSIPGVASDTNYSFSNGKLNLGEGNTITWNTVNEEPMDFAEPYSVAWRGDAYGMFSQLPQTFNANNTRSAAFSPDGSLLLVSGYSSTDIYSVENETLTYVSTINYGAKYITFNHAGTVAILDEKIYTVSGTTLTYVTDIDDNDEIAPSAFSPNDDYLFHGRHFHKINVASITASIEIEAAPDVVYSIAVHPTAIWHEVLINGTIMTYYGNEQGSLLQPFVEGELQVDGATLNGVTSAEYVGGGAYIACIANGRPILFSSNGIRHTAEFVSYINTGIRDAQKIVGTNVDNDDMQYIVFTTTSHGVPAYRLSKESGELTLVTDLLYNGTKVTEGASLLALNENANLLISGMFVYFPILYFMPIDWYRQLLLVSNTLMVEKYNDTILVNMTEVATVPTAANNVTIAITSEKITCYFFRGKSQLVGTSEFDLDTNITDVDSIQIFGQQIIDWLYITPNEDYDYSIVDKPAFDGTAYFFADFENETLEAGASGSTGSEFSAIYRLDPKTGLMTKLFELGDYFTKIKDFGAKSMTNYKYRLYYVSENGVYASATTSADVCVRFDGYYLYETEQYSGEPENVYHVKNIWKFGNNYSGGGVSNGNAPQFLTNFTRYPLRQGTNVSPKSGTLTALLSNAVNGVYEDTAVQMDALYELSHSQRHIFLKDTKGNMYEVHTSAPISMTVDTASRAQEVSVSVPWQEVADASDAVIIQDENDEEWSE